MPTSRFIQAKLNPVKFIEMNPSLIPAYLSRHMDEFFYYETLAPWQAKKKFYQPWQTTDEISLQVQSTFDPVKLSLIDIDERVYNSFNLAQGAADVDDPNLYIYEGSLDLSTFGEGIYLLRIEGGAPDVDGNYPLTLISEPFSLKVNQPNTLYLQYSNYTDKDGVIFQTGFAPTIRIRSTLRLKSPSSKDTLFEDQILGMTMIQSRPFRIWEMKIGGASGIPDYLADKLNRILGCSNVLIDGRPYTKSDGARMEDNAVENYPLRGWQIDLREAENAFTVVYKNGAVLREDTGFSLREDGGLILLE